MKLTNVLCAVIAALVAGQAGPALAQPYPDRPVVIVPPYPAGGTPDLVARILGEKMAALWGKSVLVEAKPGGNGVIGTGSVAQSAPDGYTLLLATLSHVTNPLLQKGVRWDPVGDFAGLAEVATAPVVATVPASLPVDTLKAFAEFARKAPDKLNYLMPGIGTSMHLNTEMFKSEAGIELVASTRFVQHYSAGHYRDTVRKQIDWVKVDGQWRIAAETVLALSPADPTASQIATPR